MSVRAVAYMKEMQVCPNGEQITGREKFIGIILADSHQDKAHARTFPAVVHIARDSVTSERQCLRVLASLERKGIIRREYPTGKGRGCTTFYFFPELDEDVGRAAAFTVGRKPVSHTLFREECHGVTLPKIAEKDDIVSPLSVENSQEGCHGVTLSVENSLVEPVENLQKPPSPYSEKSVISRIASNNSKYKYKYKDKDKDKDPPQPPEGGKGGLKIPPDPLKNETPPQYPPSRDSLIDRAAEQVMKACGFARPRLLDVLRPAIGLRCDCGEDPHAVGLAMIAAWNEQAEKRSRGLLRAHYGAERFFGDGHWKETGTWHWDNEALERRQRF